MISKNGLFAPVNIHLAGVTGLSGLYILSLDPGGDTGWCRAIFGYESVEISGGQLTGEHHRELYDLMTEIKPDLVISESFEFRQHKGGEGRKDKVELISKEYIGIAKFWCQVYNVEYIEQSPSQASGLVKDRRLAMLGLFYRKVADRHFHDACRHMIYHMVVKMGLKKAIAPHWLG